MTENLDTMNRISILGTVFLLAACAQEQAPKTGIYPGNPDEDFSPALVKDNSYRNVAELRQAYATSSYDYNLTAQLATDGIVEDREPAYMTLSVNGVPVPRNEREWLFDNRVTAKLQMEGQSDTIELGFHNYQPKFSKSKVFGQMHPAAGWQIEMQALTEEGWKTLGKQSGKALIDAEFDVPVVSASYRLIATVDKPCRWDISNWDFLPAGESVETSPVIFENNIIESYRREKLVSVQPQKEFVSAWMSAEGGDQAIWVDLGTVCKVDKVELKWLSSPAEGTIQVSEDAQDWKDVAELSCESSKSFRKTKARYVKLALRGSDSPYVLSEFKVMGRGGLVPQAHAQAAQAGDRLALSGGSWKLQRASQVGASGEQISAADFDDAGWLVATVPATVLSSYVNAGALPDPNYSDNQFQISESFFDSDFWYRDTFEVPASYAGKRITLNFDGINWKADVYVNGQAAGRIEGAFIRGLFDVTDIVRPGETNTLAVKIYRNDHPAAVKEQNAISAEINGGVLGGDNPTFHATVGWDWIPTVRGRDIGIWNDVYLAATGAVTIEDPLVYSTLPLPDTTSADIHVSARLANHGDSPVTGTFRGHFGDIEFAQELTLEPGSCKEMALDPIHIDNPRLWWPVGYGEPNLYDVDMEFVADGKASDSKSFKSGIRQMTWNEDNGILTLFVNGRRFVGRGGNWGFSESNLNYRGREYDAAVRYHADMNFTMIRDWVGQIGDEEFYDACDKYGVMVWQDFWLANPWDGPDPYNEKMFMANAEDYVKRIRNHASIGLYCGRNEGNPPASLNDALTALVAKEGAGIHYTPNSAHGVLSGEGPYRALEPREYFNLRGQERFHSERGMPCVMNYESLLKTIPEELAWPHGRLWGVHDFVLENAQRGETFIALLERAFGPAESAREFCDLAQWINYNGYRAMFEGRSSHRRGLLLWMSHPAWPSMVWQTYDYYLDPTAAYFGCKKANEPLHIQFNSFTGNVEVVNLSAGSGRTLTARAEIVDMYGKPCWSKEIQVVSDEDTTIECFAIEVPESAGEVYNIRLALMEDGRLCSENLYVEGREYGDLKALRTLPKAELSRTVKVSAESAELTLVNTSDVPAYMIRVKVESSSTGEPVTPAIYSDNYFTVFPGETKTVSVSYCPSDVAGKPVVSLSGFNLN